MNLRDEECWKLFLEKFWEEIDFNRQEFTKIHPDSKLYVDNFFEEIDNPKLNHRLVFCQFFVTFLLFLLKDLQNIA